MIKLLGMFLLSAFAFSLYGVSFASSADTSQVFEKLTDVDLPGFDYRSPKNEKGLTKIGWWGCESICHYDPKCKAYTYNEKSEWCFLKAGIGNQKTFKNVMSGIKKLIVNDYPSAHSNFKLMPSQALGGFAYQDPRNNTDLINTGVKGCMRRCDRDRECKAFTYDYKANWCFLKNGYKTSKRFKNAISGIKKKKPPKVSLDNTALKAALTSWPPSVSEIRKAAIKYGGDCKVETQKIHKRFFDTKVSTNSEALEAGQNFEINWKTSKIEKNLPVYLMISFDQPVRFDGPGFYPLLPNSQAAFGIKWNKKHTRAIIPLYGIGAQQKGQLLIKPLLAADMNVQWAIAGYVRKCQQEVVQFSSSSKYQVLPNQKFEVILNEPASLIQPTKVIINDDGNRRVEIFKDSYKLIDHISGTMISEGAGEYPNFSPTGRYLTVHTHEKMNVMDAVDGIPIHYGKVVGWQNDDSYMITGGFDYGKQSVSFSNHINLSFGTTEGSHNSFGLKTNYSILDLENNIAFLKTWNNNYASDLLSKKKIYSGRDEIGEFSYESDSYKLFKAIRTITKKTSLANLFIPNHKIFIEKTKFTKILYNDYINPEKSEGIYKTFYNQMIHPHDITKKQLSSFSNSETSRLNEIRLRNINWSTPEKKGLHQFDILEQLRLFGLNFAEVNIPLFNSDKEIIHKDDRYIRSVPDEKIKQIIKQIYSQNPKVKGLFRRPSNLSMCNLDNNSKLTDQMTTAINFKISGRPIWIIHHQCSTGTGITQVPSLTLFDKTLKQGYLELNLQENGKHKDNKGCAHIEFCDMNMRLSQNRYLTFGSSLARGVAIFDVELGKVIFKKYNLPKGELLKSIDILEDKNHFLQLNSDYGFYVHRISDGQQILEGRVADEEVIIWTDTGHYDATSEGVQFVSLKFPGRNGLYSFQQFEKQLHIEGLLQKILSNKKLPVVPLKTPPSFKAKFNLASNSQIIFETNLSANSNVKKFNIYQDGLLTNKLNSSGLKKETLTIERLPGARWISAIAVDADGVASLPIGNDIGPDKDRKTKLHYLTVGIDEYKKANDLSFGVSDAKNLAKALKTIAGKNIELGVQNSLVNLEASKEAILVAANKMVQDAKVGDTIVFSFAGHGVRDQNGKFYLATSSMDPDNTPETGFLWEELISVFKRSKARIIVFIDACHSGAAGTDDSIYATNDQVASGLLTSIPSGLLIFSASKGRELSEEDGVRGGVFTNAVTDVISNKRNIFDTNGNGAIEISELYKGVKKEVVRKAKGKQTPWLARNQMIGDFSLF